MNSKSGTELKQLLWSYEKQPSTPRTRQSLKTSLVSWATRHGYLVPHVFYYNRGTSVLVGDMGAGLFEEILGRPPGFDDLERVNCREAGKPTHLLCGWCDDCGLPRFECGHASDRRE